ncbi:MAG: precorrin-3B C(17)-methyltransferase [Firmicutes bacterium]|nr:precorrin-3B C(17)-methyltransferase [Bacillota bacterium]
MSFRAKEAIEDAEVVVGYRTYLDLITELIAGKEVLASGMTQEVERCRQALDRALQGKRIALVTSGDPGIYGMAGLILEMVHKEGMRLPVEIIPGITAALAAAASLGAPLMNDFAAISLSDLMTPWEIIERRLAAAAEADFVTVLYNPRSSTRREQLARAREIFLRYRDENTPVGVVRNCKRGDEEINIHCLRDFLDLRIDMLTTVIIGNSTTFTFDKFMITPRGYRL